MLEPGGDTYAMKNRINLAYTTAFGRAYQGDSRDLFAAAEVESGSVDLIFTSPPFALTSQKDYGNEPPDQFLDWFATFLPGFKRVLAPRGSLVIDVGGAYLPGKPKRSTYHFQLAVMLAKHFDLCQEFYWYNPAKLPAPIQWTNVERIRVKDSVNLLLWLANDASETKANNKRVLRQYSKGMRSLLRNGYTMANQKGNPAEARPSNWVIRKQTFQDRGGAIPPNLIHNILSISNTGSGGRYLEACRAHQIKPHDSRFPPDLPDFFVNFLTEPGDLVLDPFSGSNTTGFVAESLERRWIACELDAVGPGAGTYVRTSAFRFPNAKMQEGFDALPAANWKRAESDPTGSEQSQLTLWDG